MKSYTIVSRKTVEDDRIAICPKFGCENLTRVKPLKLGFLGFGKYPKCRKHQIPLVYVDERIRDFVNAALSCLFDISGLPPQNLLFTIKKEIPEEVEPFIKKWIYCITTGRGAPIISQYMDSISNSYFKQLSKKQMKFLKNENKSKKTEISLAIKNGIHEITDQYTRLLKHLRIHHDVFNEPKELNPLSNRSKKILSRWLESSKKANKALLSIESKQNIPLSKTKRYYDSILNMGICMCLLGYSTKKRENLTKQISAFDRFNAYFEFYSNGLTQKFTKTDIEKLLKHDFSETSLNQNMQDGELITFLAQGRKQSAIKIAKIENVDKPYTYITKDLITDLKIEIQKLSEELTQMFPNRLINGRSNAFSNRDLSRLWANDEHFIMYQLRLAKKDSSFIVSEEALMLLKTKLKERLGAKALGCFQIVRRYQSKEISTYQFVDILEKELGRVSGEIQLRNEELSLILLGTHQFIRHILERISLYDYHPAHNPYYKFSKERLSQFRDSLFEIFGDRAKKCFVLLERYKLLNPDLKEYSKQQYEVKKPNYFQNVENEPEVSYWFGFMRADASRSGAPHRIYFELAEKDIDRLEEFVKAIELPLDRIKFRTRYKWYKGVLKGYNSAYLQFVCRPMAKDIDDLGFQSSKADQKNIPNYIVQALEKAKEIAKHTNFDWWLTLPGKVALAFLLGFYDGDGYYGGGKRATIYASSKKFLRNIKETFEIKNIIFEAISPGETAWIFDKRYVSKGMYSLALGPKLFDMMISSYNDSMKRKRP